MAVLEQVHYERSTCEHPITAHERFAGAGVGKDGKPDGSDVLGRCFVDRCSCDGQPDEAGKAAASERAQAAKKAKQDELRAQLAELEGTPTPTPAATPPTPAAPATVPTTAPTAPTAGGETIAAAKAAPEAPPHDLTVKP